LPSLQSSSLPLLSSKEAQIMTAKYSVLIPVFKTDPALLKRCLNSILQEKRDDVEIVLVEALSNGESVFQKLDSETKTHVLYFISDKASIPYQRNLTLSHCLGTYLVFVDSDDYLLPGAFSLFDSCLEATPTSDLIVFSHTSREADLLSPFNPAWIHQSTSKAVFFNAFSSCDRDGFTFEEKSIWAKLFRRSLIVENHLTFEETLYSSEDHLFLLSYLCHCQSVTFAVKYAVYHYFSSRGSISPKPFNNSPDSYLRIMSTWNKLLSNFPSETDLRKSWSYNASCVYLPRSLAYYFCLPNNFKSKKDAFSSFRSLAKNNDFAMAIRYCNFRWCRNSKKRFQLYLLKSRQLRLYFDLFWKLYHHQ
jgi:glycosyltransferase involved in cell wall biosynthesis